MTACSGFRHPCPPLWFLSAAFALLMAAPVAHAEPPTPAGYHTQGICAGYPRLPLRTPKGWCAALVADARDGLRMPRRLIEVAPGRFWITDMGNWEPRQGRLLELNTAGQPGEPQRLRMLAKGLDRPHGLQRGPDGRFYVAEAGTVWRTPVSHVERETVLADLPSDGAHPLKEIAFGPSGRLYVNMGSVTDACRPDPPTQPHFTCPEIAGSMPRAAVYETIFGGPDFTRQSFQPFARGLRNSLGLAITTDSRGTAHVWQAENSVDYTDANAPAEELNELGLGANYGWPYCVSDEKGRSVVARGHTERGRCEPRQARAPFQAWPARVAPLQLLAVPAAPKGAAETPWSGRLLAVWHGYRPTGHRIVAWRIGADGRPRGAREDIVSGWDAAPGRRPLGSPAGITIDSQGRLWIVEDRNRTVILIAPESPPTPPR